MSTRAVILVHGRHIYIAKSQRTWCRRLYQHSDGYPTGVLPELLAATKAAEACIEKGREQLRDSSVCEGEPSVAKMPADSFTGFLIGASTDWYGPAMRYDYDHVGDVPVPHNQPASYQGPVERRAWGDQGDLEWMYLVDMPSRTITIYGGEYGTPDDHLSRGPVDPIIRCGELLADYQGPEYLRTVAHLNALRLAGWTITPGGEKGKVKTALTKLRKQLVMKAIEFVTGFIKPDQMTTDLDAMLGAAKRSCSLGNFPILADMLEEAGIGDRNLWGQMRLAS